MRVSHGKIIEESPRDGQWNWHFVRICTVIDHANYLESSYNKFREVLDRALKNGYPIDFRGVLKNGDSQGFLWKNETLLEHVLSKIFVPYKVAQALVCDYGADVNIKNKIGRSSLMQLCERSPKGAEDFPLYLTLFQEIVERTNSNDINSIDLLKLTPLKFLVQKHVFWRKWDATEETDLFDYQRIKMLLSRGAVESIDEWEKGWENSNDARYSRKTPEQQKCLDKMRVFLKTYHEQQIQQEPNQCCFEYDMFL